MATKRKKPLSEVAQHIDKGGLHRSLGIPQGRKLTQADLARGEKMGGKTARQVALARTFAKYRKKR